MEKLYLFKKEKVTTRSLFFFLKPGVLHGFIDYFSLNVGVTFSFTGDVLWSGRIGIFLSIQT